MLHRLPVESYAKVRSLTGAFVDHHLAVHAVLNGSFNAPVFVDQLESPRLALTWTTSRVFLAGLPDDPLTDLPTDPAIFDGVRDVFAGTYTPYARNAQRAQFVLHARPFDYWALHCDDLFPGLYPVEGQRSTFFLRAGDDLRHDWRTLLPDGYTLHPVDRDLLARVDLARMDDLREEMCSERVSVAAFLQHSFGVCVVADGALAGWCLSEYNTAHGCEVGIEVAEAHRQRGLGTVLATAFAEAAFARGLTQIGWHCWADNAPSAALARAVGYRLAHEERVYFGFFEGALNLAIRGNFALRELDYSASADWFEQALAANTDVPAWVYYQSARAYAQAGQCAEALRNLEAAVTRGWPEARAPLTECDDFAPLHTLPGWAALLARFDA